MDIDAIKQRIMEGNYEFSIHAQQERLEDDLDITEIETAIMGGEVIENYPDDPRGESCLVLGYVGPIPVHLVMGWAYGQSNGEKTLRIITVYIPQAPKWEDPRRRGGKTS
ncbi:DUF4258 domain-containing protein [Candidatus Nitronereus thalassa]|uniref:DUF4258 domain-containing protein n=1 Tax=Candidatus Nitronereus thalassa TaxID=3020898 RepID=A0ABU3K866_9BACT|nr:DUF4258 domain-containing protein [Candidatus Nitronereus thalassa]MDT7042589.1 DUF4258 domain-containing protein [Candidatus Nitronereus thalassa]